jgi:hypothetical protein
LAALQLGADRRPAARVPGRLDQEPTHMRVADLRDRVGIRKSVSRRGFSSSARSAARFGFAATRYLPTVRGAAWIAPRAAGLDLRTLRRRRRRAVVASPQRDESAGTGGAAPSA